ncbi:hypothetical protein AB0L13_26020 [Saccharopolyspora shandongensis]|uniref:hypothetical protein n=1 Tax=Saccharopolyspora shandongensis TaxID=418495 RepID=UPI00343F462F
METWARGQDVADTAGVVRRASLRLRHVANLDVITSAFSYRNRGLSPPEAAIRISLEAPDGSTWIWGDSSADQVVSGSAIDFCLVVTQRRHIDDTQRCRHGHTGARAQAPVLKRSSVSVRIGLLKRCRQRDNKCRCSTGAGASRGWGSASGPGVGVPQQSEHPGDEPHLLDRPDVRLQ